MLKKLKFNNLFFKTGKLSFCLLIFSFLIFSLVLILDFKFCNQTWVVKLLGHLIQRSDILIISLVFFILSYLILATNFTTTILASKLKLDNLPVCVLTLFLSSILLISFLPMFNSVILMSSFTEVCNIFFGFILTSTHSSLENFAWMVSYPTFFIVILPTMGIISHIVLKISKKYKIKKNYLIWNLIFIGILGHLNWLINLVTLSFNFDFDLGILVLILRNIVGLAVFLLLINWCFSLYKSEIQLETIVLFAIGYIITMLLGLCILFLSSLTNLKIEILLYHLFVHVTFFALFAGFYFCFSKIFGFYYSEFLGVLQFWFFFIGSNLNFFPYYFGRMVMFQNRNANSGWDEFLDTASEFGFYFLVVSFLLFIIVLIEALVKKRTNKDSILNLSKFYIKDATSKLDFLIAICFLIYFLFFFVLSIINQIYWVLIVYGILLLIGVICSMAPPKVTHYFSPLKETSSQLHYNYKHSWLFLYYFVQFLRIFFIGLNLYFIFFLGKNLQDIYGDPNFPFYIAQLQSSNLMILYKICSPIFFISVVLEMCLKLYHLWLIDLTEYYNKPKPRKG